MNLCPACRAPLGADDRVCASCGTPLSTTPSAATPLPPTPLPPTSPPRGDTTRQPGAELRLGTFDPRVLDIVVALLNRRGVPYLVVERDDEVEVRIHPTWRDDLRTELLLTWDELLDAMDAQELSTLRRGRGLTPGWFDPPRGGYIDRAGRMVVSDADDEEEHRVIGPALLAAGAVLAVFGWYAMDSGPLLSAGFALAVLGLFIPR